MRAWSPSTRWGVLLTLLRDRTRRASHVVVMALGLAWASAGTGPVGEARAAEVADLRAAFVAGDYRRAVAVGDTLLAQGLPGGREVGVRAVMAAAWLEESRVAERMARFEAEVLTDAYGGLATGASRAALEAGIPDRLPFYRGLAAILAGEADTARVVLGRMADDPAHPYQAAAAVWRRVADEALSPAMMVSGVSRDAVGPADATGQRAILESALLHLALTGRVDDPARERLAAMAEPAPGTREERLARLLRWEALGPDAGGALLVDAEVLAAPVDRIGTEAEGGVALHDPFVLLAYARLALREARAALPTGDAFGRAGRFLARTRAQLALQEGRTHEATAALADATEPADRALLAQARVAGTGATPVEVIDAAAPDSTGRALADCVLLWDRDPSTDWDTLAPLVRARVDRWLRSWEGVDGHIDDHWARWAAALCTLRAGDGDPTSYLDGVYDPGRHGNLERNPALRLPETLGFLMQDVNNQVLVLRAASETAEHVASAWGVYDALQAYFLVRFVDTPVGVRP